MFDRIRYYLMSYPGEITAVVVLVVLVLLIVSACDAPTAVACVHVDGSSQLVAADSSYFCEVAS